MTRIEKIAALLNQLKCQPRLKLKHDNTPEAWSNMGIGLPVRGYIELNGPWPFREVEWLEINPIVMERVGRLVAPKQWSHLEQIASFLQLEGVEYKIIDGMVRIPFDALIN
ncbi:DUF6678 family protein [Hymenobacter armeniacus]|uniref:Uncharacterized protein n=1 Tax=Hymenobacter armeniacus TaxID=2771358 RepID=A0ABR8JX62_9BACT|nr:DUF6678 family protein [Hymenobacter armeniacus]MBD2724551.1 hypothetical protein [Hymenobacter armeniacus]